MNAQYGALSLWEAWDKVFTGARLASSWLEEEPGLAEVRDEVHRVVSDARSRAGWVVLLALLSSAGGALFVSQRPPSFTSRTVLRVHDGKLEPGAPPPSAYELVNKLNKTALTRPVLLRVMRSHGLLSGVSEQALDRAVDDVRERTGLKVVRDYISEPGGAQIRSTQLAISFTATDPEQALNVARTLGSIVATAETGSRFAAAQSTIDAVEAGSSAVLAELQRSEAEAATLRHRLPALDGRDQLVGLMELRRVVDSSQRLREQLEALTMWRSALSLPGYSSDGELGVHFEVLDPGHLAPAPRFTRGERLALTFVVLLLLGVPSLGLLFGLFDGRIKDERRLRRLGMRSLGQIPSFTGDHLGSLRARTSGEHC